MADQNDNSPGGSDSVQMREEGGGGLNGDVVDATLEAGTDDDTSGDAEIEALEEEDDEAGEADVTASGAE